MPDTGRVAFTPEEKATIFKETFFPPPPSADLQDMEGAVCDAQIHLPPISETEVMEAINDTAPSKAPGPDGIPNKALQTAAPWIAGHLARIFDQSIRLGHCPHHFRQPGCRQLQAQIQPSGSGTEQRKHGRNFSWPTSYQQCPARGSQQWPDSFPSSKRRSKENQRSAKFFSFRIHRVQ